MISEFDEMSQSSDDDADSSDNDGGDDEGSYSCTYAGTVSKG